MLFTIYKNAFSKNAAAKISYFASVHNIVILLNICEKTAAFFKNVLERIFSKHAIFMASFFAFAKCAKLTEAFFCFY